MKPIRVAPCLTVCGVALCLLLPAQLAFPQEETDSTSLQPPGNEPQPIRDAFFGLFSKSRWTQDDVSAMSDLVSPAALEQIFATEDPSELDEPTLAQLHHHWWGVEDLVVFGPQDLEVTSSHKENDEESVSVSSSSWYQGRGTGSPHTAGEEVRRKRRFELQMGRGDTEHAWRITSMRVVNDTSLSYSDQIVPFWLWVLGLQLLLITASIFFKWIAPGLTVVIGVIAAPFLVFFSAGGTSGWLGALFWLGALVIILVLQGILGDWVWGIGILLAVLFVILHELRRHLSPIIDGVLLLLAILAAAHLSTVYFAGSPWHEGMALLLQVSVGGCLFLRFRGGFLFFAAATVVTLSFLAGLATHALFKSYPLAAAIGALLPLVCFSLLAALSYQARAALRRRA